MRKRVVVTKKLFFTVRRRVNKLKIYFSDLTTPVVLENVEHIQAEGGLLRLIIDGKSQWWPLCNVASIIELDMDEAGVVWPDYLVKA